MAEAARVKRVSYHTVSRAVRSGKVAATRLGRMALIDAADLQAWEPMRERAPRKYRHELDERGSHGTRPTFSEPVDPVPYIDRLGTAVATLHDGAANRATEGFGDWVASLTASLLVLRSVVIWLLDEVSGQFTPYGAYGIVDAELSATLSGAEGEAMRYVLERGAVQCLDAMTADQITGSWISPEQSGVVVAVPCRQGSRSLGLIIGVAGRRGGSAHDVDLRVAGQFGTQVAIAIEHLELRRSTRQTLVSSPALFDDLPLSVMAIDRFGQLVYVNREVVRQWGVVIQDRYVGRHYAHFVGMFRRERLDGSVVRIHDHPFTRALRGEHVHNEPHLVPTFFDAPRIFSLSSRPLHDEHGALSGAVLISRDVTAEMQAADGGVSSLELLAEARRRVDVLGALPSEIGSGEYGNDVFGNVAQRVCEALNGDSGAVLAPATGSHVMIRALYRLSVDGFEVGRELDRLRVPTSILSMTQREMFAVTEEDSGLSGRALLAESKARSVVMIPLLYGDEALGVVNVLFADATQAQLVDRDFAMAVGRQCGQAVHLHNVMQELEACQRRKGGDS
jgi:excisionase family DNA binding protein